MPQETFLFGITCFKLVLNFFLHFDKKKIGQFLWSADNLSKWEKKAEQVLSM